MKRSAKSSRGSTQTQTYADAKSESASEDESEKSNNENISNNNDENHDPGKETDQIIRVQIDEDNSSVFKHLVEYLKKTNKEGNFIFHPDKIVYTAVNNNNSLLNELVLTPKDYQYKSEKPFVVAGVVLGMLQKFIKAIQKKHSMILSMDRDETYLIVQPYQGSDSKPGNKDFIRLKEIEVFDNHPGNYPVKETCKISMTEFAEVCKVMSEVPCKLTSVKGFARGFIFESKIGGNMGVRKRELGIIDAPKITKLTGSGVGIVKSSNSPKQTRSEPIISPASSSSSVCSVSSAADNSPITKKKPIIKLTTKVEISIETKSLKSIYKIHHLNEDGNLTLTLAEDLALRITSDIGSIGHINIYLRDMVPKN